MAEDFPRTTLSFYRYVILENINEMRDSLYREFDALQVFGRIYIAREGSMRRSLYLLITLKNSLKTYMLIRNFQKSI